MKKNKDQTFEIVSFNRPAFEVSTLLELDEADLERVTGGLPAGPDEACSTFVCNVVSCGALNCGIFIILDQ